MACDVTALMLYSIDALGETEVVKLAHHVTGCSRCQKRLTDRNEFRAAVIACFVSPVRAASRRKRGRHTLSRRVAAASDSVN